MNAPDPSGNEPPAEGQPHQITVPLDFPTILGRVAAVIVFAVLSLVTIHGWAIAFDSGTLNEAAEPHKRVGGSKPSSGVGEALMFRVAAPSALWLLAAILLTALMARGKESYRLQGQDLILTRQVYMERKERAFAIAMITNLRVSRDRFWFYQLAFDGAGRGTIAFDFSMRTIWFGVGLSEEQAAEFIQQLQPLLARACPKETAPSVPNDSSPLTEQGPRGAEIRPEGEAGEQITSQANDPGQAPDTRIEESISAPYTFVEPSFGGMPKVEQGASCPWVLERGGGTARLAFPEKMDEVVMCSIVFFGLVIGVGTAIALGGFPCFAMSLVPCLILGYWAYTSVGRCTLLFALGQPIRLQRSLFGLTINKNLTGKDVANLDLDSRGAGVYDFVLWGEVRERRQPEIVLCNGLIDVQARVLMEIVNDLRSGRLDPPESP